MNPAKKTKKKTRKLADRQAQGVLREEAPSYVANSLDTERNGDCAHEYLAPNGVYLGDSRVLIPRIRPSSVALSFWSPPYFVGKEYEKHLTFHNWQELLKEVIECHVEVLIPGGFMVINIANILCF